MGERRWVGWREGNLGGMRREGSWGGGREGGWEGDVLNNCTSLSLSFCYRHQHIS